tara:strand:- start:905 stop:1207 length:303 start_codon:yes stop_codon:yes gene_type:complete
MKDPTSRFSKFKTQRIRHKGIITRPLSSSRAWNIIAHKNSTTRSNLIVIPNGMGGRPDLLSQKAYGTPKYWWLICAVNNISDPFEQIIPGKTIKLPIIQR